MKMLIVVVPDSEDLRVLNGHLPASSINVLVEAVTFDDAVWRRTLEPAFYAIRALLDERAKVQ